eukprot:18150-Eustigmatos_ZCMA.PRE.1
MLSIDLGPSHMASRTLHSFAAYVHGADARYAVSDPIEARTPCMMHAETEGSVIAAQWRRNST